jgi:hypothetical protein
MRVDYFATGPQFLATLILLEWQKPFSFFQVESRPLHCAKFTWSAEEKRC